MSIVTFKYAGKSYCYESKLQYEYASNAEDPVFWLEEHIMEEIKEQLSHMNPRPTNGYIHDVVFNDDSGIIGNAKDFSDIRNFTIKKH